jgi:methyl-accepting chemotaxis protein
MSKLKFLTNSMNGKLTLLNVVFVIGFLIFGSLALSTLNTARVNGPHYVRVVQNKDLLADVLPPPNYIVETYLTAHLMVSETDPQKVTDLITKYNETLKVEYADRQAHWRETLDEGPLKHEINETSRVPAEAFFVILDEQLIPAVQSGDKELANKILNETLPPLYELHRSSVDLIVKTTLQNATDTEAEVAALIAARKTTMLGVGFALLAGVVGFGYYLSRSVRRQETEMARINSMMDQAPVNVIFTDPNLIVQYMNPASHKTWRKLESHLSVKADDLIGQSVDVLHEQLESQRRNLADQSKLPLQLEITVGDDTLDLLASAVLDSNRKFLGTMVTWSVITERLAMEKRLKDRADEERRVAKETDEKVGVVLSVVNSIASGDFNQSVPNLGNDAIGQVGDALNSAIASVRGTLTEVRDVAATVANAAQQMSSASEEIASGAQEQASSLEETASSLEEITSTVKQNTDNAQQARQLATGSRDVAEKGGSVVGKAVDAMRAINGSSKQISDIITTIDEIAFQTNLLALNAAVEAARAGEQGRGFAVVAAEVRNLAQRSAAAAKEIKTLIQDSRGKVENGTELVNKSGETLTEIVDSVKQVTDIVSEIAAASNEQLIGIEQVNRAVAEMDRVTQSNATQTEEMSGTSMALLTHAEQLSAIVAKFRLEEARVEYASQGSRQAASTANRVSESRFEEREPVLAGAGSDGGNFFEEF